MEARFSFFVNASMLWNANQALHQLLQKLM
jgi:hypothetical protein